MANDIKISNESSQERTTKRIAFILIGIYGVALVIIGVTAAVKPAPENQTWVELLKSGFLILGGGLTTVIGYYFGSRGVQEAQTSAQQARIEAEKAKEETQKLEAVTPTLDEESLILPEDMPESE